MLLPQMIFAFDAGIAVQCGIGTNAATLNSAFASRPGAWFALTTSADQRSLEQHYRAAAELRETPQIAFVPDSDADAFAGLTAEIGPALTCLTIPPDLHATLVLSPQVVSTNAPFRDLDEPVWDFVMRAAIAQPNGLRQISQGDTGRLSTSLAALAVRGALPELAPQIPGQHRNWLREHLSGLPLATLLPSVSAAADLTALQAGLWQVHDLLDESHQCVQQIEGEGRDRNGDYWHAIMHRREPDYSNSKYWFRRVGSHPVFASLPAIAETALHESKSKDAGRWIEKLGGARKWDASAFVDLCQTIAGREDERLAQAARRIQRAEMLLLLAHSYRCATNG